VNVPPEARRQLDEVVDGFRGELGDALVGVYVHGSIAFGCFNVARSDVDVLIVAERPLDVEEKLRLADVLLRASAVPYAVELHVLTREQLARWRHPSPFELHYGESHREGFAFDPVGTLAAMASTDPDLAAHVTVARALAIPLVGPAADDVFPPVPWADYEDSLRRDLAWSRNVKSALYGVLSPCRVWASLATRDLHSKASGAAWALERLPADLRPLVASALASYTGTGEPIDVDEPTRQRLIDEVERELA
jgi:streptomycin 3"-adenylyltransferase